MIKLNIEKRLLEHYEEAKTLFPIDNIVMIGLQGSQNYNLETEFSDVDSKLIVTPSLETIVTGANSVSTTHIRANEEHIDLKDIRLMFQNFKKQNINFVEILFTKYKIVNKSYEPYMKLLFDNNELIAHYNPYIAVKCMEGMAFEKLHALEHPYPSKIQILEEKGYDPKQLHHILRMEEFINRYIDGETYAKCLISEKPEYLKDIKRGILTLEEARQIAETSTSNIRDIANNFCNKISKQGNPEVEDLLNLVQKNIIIESLKKEINK